MLSCFPKQLPFDYFIICKPIVIPLQIVFDRGWLGCNQVSRGCPRTASGFLPSVPPPRSPHPPLAPQVYRWHAYWPWGAPCLGGDWVLAVVRIFPFLLIFILDTSLFYQVGRRRVSRTVFEEVAEREGCPSNVFPFVGHDNCVWHSRRHAQD